MTKLLINGEIKEPTLKKAVDTKIQRHIKIVATTNPFNPDLQESTLKQEKRNVKITTLSNDTELTGLKIIQPYKNSRATRQLR